MIDRIISKAYKLTMNSFFPLLLRGACWTVVLMLCLFSMLWLFGALGDVLFQDQVQPTMHDITSMVGEYAFREGLKYVLGTIVVLFSASYLLGRIRGVKKGNGVASIERSIVKFPAAVTSALLVLIALLPVVLVEVLVGSVLRNSMLGFTIMLYGVLILNVCLYSLFSFIHVLLVDPTKKTTAFQALVSSCALVLRNTKLFFGTLLTAGVMLFGVAVMVVFFSSFLMVLAGQSMVNSDVLGLLFTSIVTIVEGMAGVWIAIFALAIQITLYIELDVQSEKESLPYRVAKKVDIHEVQLG